MAHLITIEKMDIKDGQSVLVPGHGDDPMPLLFANGWPSTQAVYGQYWTQRFTRWNGSLDR